MSGSAILPPAHWISAGFQTRIKGILKVSVTLVANGQLDDRETCLLCPASNGNNSLKQEEGNCGGEVNIFVNSIGGNVLVVSSFSKLPDE